MHNVTFYPNRQDTSLAKVQKADMQHYHVLLFTFILMFSLIVPGYATTNVGTAGAQFLKIGPGARVDSFRWRIRRNCKRRHNYLLESSRVKPTQKNQLFRYTHDLACRCPIQLSRLCNTYREDRHIRRQVSHFSTFPIPKSQRLTPRMAQDFGTPHGIPQSHWHIPDNSIEKNPVPRSPSVSIPNISISKFIEKAQEGLL